jgi:hypothetical protein
MITLQAASKAPIALQALPQRVGEGLDASISLNLLGEYPEGGRGAFHCSGTFTHV